MKDPIRERANEIMAGNRAKREAEIAACTDPAEKARLQAIDSYLRTDARDSTAAAHATRRQAEKDAAEMADFASHARSASFHLAGPGREYMSAGSHKSACLEIYRNNKHLREDLDSIMQGELWADEWRLQYVVRVTVEEMTKDEMNTAIVKLMAEMIRANVEAGQWPDSMVFATLRAIGDRKMRRAEMDEVINAWAEQARARRLAIKMAAFK